MSSYLKTCAAKDIHELNQRKEYTLISTQLLEYIFADPNLTPPVIKCWQLLFNFARFNSNLQITISYNQVAKELNRSKRTVIRYIQLLEKNGYLSTLVNVDNTKGYTANTLLVRAPIDLINKIKISKDRASYIKTNSTCEVLLENVDHQTTTISQNDLHTIEASQTSNDAESVPQVSTDPCLPHDINSANASQEITPKLSLGPSDNHDTTINNINININNNNIVVDLLDSKKSFNKAFQSKASPPVPFPISSQVSQLNLEKEKLEELDHREGLKLSGLAGNSVAIYEHLKYLGFIRGKIDIIEKKITKLKQTEISAQKKQFNEINLTTPIDHMFKKPGERNIPIFTYNRLIKALELLGYKEHQLSSLINEIIFEVRFGSLNKNTTAGKPLSTEHAINIALKLVREKRWTTPTSLKKAL